MSVELWIGEEFEYGHEMEALAFFLQNMARYYSADPTRFCVVANLIVNNNPIDLAVVKNNWIGVIELKHVSGPVFGGENGDWTVGEGPQKKCLHGGSRGNPYHQVRAYRIALIKFLEQRRNKFLLPRVGLEPRLDHVTGIVALEPTAPKGSQIDIRDIRWFKVVGLDNLHREVFLARSPELWLKPKEITRLLEDVLHVRREDISKYIDNRKIIAVSPTLPEKETASTATPALTAADAHAPGSVQTPAAAREAPSRKTTASVPRNEAVLERATLSTAAPLPQGRTMLEPAEAPPQEIAQSKPTASIVDFKPQPFEEEPCLVCSLGMPGCAVRKIRGNVEAIATSGDSQYILRLTNEDFDLLSIPVHQSWNEYVRRLKSWLDVNESVPAILLHLEKDGETLRVGENSLLVIEPDWLINVTDMTKVEFCSRQLLLDRFVGSPTNEHMIRGNLVHLLFPDIWKAKRGKELAQRRLELLRKQVGDFIASESSPDQIAQKCDDAIEHISQWVDRRKRATRLRTETFVLSPTLGMKGKIDFLWEEPTKNQIVGIGELKTGRSQGDSPKPGHALQLLSYTMMLLARGEISIDEVHALLLYSGNDMLGNQGNNLHRKLAPTFQTVRNAVNVRNDLVLMELTGASQFETNMNKCRGCKDFNMPCALVALLGDEEDPRPVETTKWLPPHIAIPSERAKAFFQHYASLITAELKAVKAIHANLWRKTPEQRVEQGITFRVESFRNAAPLKTGYCYELKGPNKTDFRVGDAVLVSDERGPSLGRVSLGVIQGTSEDGLQITSNEEIRFAPAWVDPYTNENLTIRLFKGLYRFVSNPTHLHDAIFDGKSPEFGSLPISDKSLVDILSKEELNDLQKKALQWALCAKSYCIVHGPPGSGKTRLIRAIVKAHRLLHKRVLICTGTNRALDEAMKSVLTEEMRKEALRLGDAGAVTDSRVRAVTLEGLIEGIEPLDAKIAAGINALRNRAVVGITASSLQSGRYEKVLGEFDLVVIDEAAQLTAPATVGCISFGKRFVLIGDHHQLPAVVQSEGLDHDDGNDANGPWSRLSKSLFEILYERAIKNSGREIVLLKDQYRMNDHICSIPAVMFYKGALRPGTRKISDARLAIDVRGLEGLERKVLDPQESVKFVDAPLDDSGGLRTNLTEAQTICRIVRALILCKYGLDRDDALGIICPRRAQVELVRRQLEQLLKEMHRIHTPEGRQILDSVSTVDRFQGSQREMIIVSFGMTDGVVSEHLADERRLNVAMSRARHKLILLGNRRALSDEPLFAKLFESMENELPYEDWYVKATC